MDLLNGLTNEDLRKKFTNQFDLVTYAIRLAENMIRSGRPSRVDSDVENPALVVLEEISLGKDKFEEIKEVPPEERRTVTDRDRDDRRAIFDKEVRLRMSKEDLMEEGAEDAVQPKRKRRILT